MIFSKSLCLHFPCEWLHSEQWMYGGETKEAHGDLSASQGRES